MTETEFDNGYWYAEDLQKFAEKIGVPSARRLRKDELEQAVRHFLRTGEAKSFARRTLTKFGRITYGDLVRHAIELNRTKDGPLRIEHGRYINFISDFMKSKKRAPMGEAIAAWKVLKKLDTPKTYQAWLNARKP